MIHFIIRSFYLVFRRHRCVKLIFQQQFFNFGDIISSGDQKLKSIGKGWYVLINNR